jgi:phosphoglucomutase
LNYSEKYKFWLENKYFDEKAKAELRALNGNEEEIKDRFYKDLEFGTGGLRGKIGMGTNRMNIYTVSRATQGLADYLVEKAREQKDSQQYLNRSLMPIISKPISLKMSVPLPSYPLLSVTLTL